jgi:hypothetical protein
MNRFSLDFELARQRSKARPTHQSMMRVEAHEMIIRKPNSCDALKAEE